MSAFLSPELWPFALATGVLLAVAAMEALALLNEPAKPVHAYNPLVQINSGKTQLEETRA